MVTMLTREYPSVGNPFPSSTLAMATVGQDQLFSPEGTYEQTYDLRMKSHPKGRPFSCDLRACTFDGTPKTWLQEPIRAILSLCQSDQSVRSTVKRSTLKLAGLHDKEKRDPLTEAPMRLFLWPNNTSQQLMGASRITGTPVTVISPEHLCSLLLMHSEDTPGADVEHVVKSLELAVVSEQGDKHGDAEAVLRAEYDLRLLCWQAVHYATVPSGEQKRLEAYCQPVWTKTWDDAVVVITAKTEEQDLWQRHNPYACLCVSEPSAIMHVMPALFNVPSFPPSPLAELADLQFAEWSNKPNMLRSAPRAHRAGKATDAKN